MSRLHCYPSNAHVTTQTQFRDSIFQMHEVLSVI
jgi:hypothetical protein